MPHCNSCGREVSTLDELLNGPCCPNGKSHQKRRPRRSQGECEGCRQTVAMVTAIVPKHIFPQAFWLCTRCLEAAGGVWEMLEEIVRVNESRTNK
jgi:hypothetical protein